MTPEHCSRSLPDGSSTRQVCDCTCHAGSPASTRRLTVAPAQPTTCEAAAAFSATAAHPAGVFSHMSPLSLTSLSSCMGSHQKNSTPLCRKQEAYDSVRGWPFGAAEAIEATQSSDITRGRLGDRWVKEYVPRTSSERTPRLPSAASMEGLPSRRWRHSACWRVRWRRL